MLDYVGAQSQLSTVSKYINYLGFEADAESGDDLREYTTNVLEPLKRDANFIVEDYSASAKFYPYPEWLCPLMSCVVLVVQPTLSSLHETRRFLHEFDRVNKETEHSARLLMVLNNTQPKAAVDKATIEQYLKHPVDIEIPYHSQCEEFLSSGRHFVDNRTALNQPINNLARLIMGKPLLKESLITKIKGLYPQRTS